MLDDLKEWKALLAARGLTLTDVLTALPGTSKGAPAPDTEDAAV